MTTFEARFFSDCPACGWRIKPRDLAQYNDRNDVVHVVCPEAADLQVAGEVCGRCFIEKSANGACGCDPE